MTSARKPLKPLLEQWALGQVGLKEIRGYTDEELYAIAHISYFFLMQGKYEEARVLYEGLVAIDPRNDYYYRALGVIFFQLGDVDRAIRQFGYAIQVKPTSPYAYVNRAEMYILQDQMQAASQDLAAAEHYMGKTEPMLKRKSQALQRVISERSHG